MPATELQEALESVHDSPVSVNNGVAVQLHGLRVMAGDVARFDRTRERLGGIVRETAAFYESESARFPEFSLQPEGRMFNAMAERAGLADIGFPSHADFSRHYHLSSLFEEDVRRLFNDRRFPRHRRAGTRALQVSPSPARGDARPPDFSVPGAGMRALQVSPYPAPV